MTDDTTKIEADLAAMTADLVAALDDSSWCSVVPMRLALEWENVLRPSGRVVRKLRGRKMRTWDALMDEVGAVLQFPDYFGENYPALDECLGDLEWLPSEVGYALVVVDPLDVLADEPVEDDDPAQTLGAFVTVLRTAVATFAEAVELGSSWDRPALAFDVLLVAEPTLVGAVQERWRAAGAPVDP